MGDLFKKLDEFMTSDLVRKIGGGVCLIALVLIAAGFLIGAKSLLMTMKGPSAAVEVTDEEGTTEDGEESDEDAEDDEDMEDDADEEDEEEADDEAEEEVDDDDLDQRKKNK